MKKIDETNISKEVVSDPIESTLKMIDDYKKSLEERKQKINDFVLLKSKGRIHANDFDEDLADEIISFCENEVTDFKFYVDKVMTFADEHISEVSGIDRIGYSLGIYTSVLTAYMSINTAFYLSNYVKTNKRKVILTRTQ
jgi:hypothetical protein